MVELAGWFTPTSLFVLLNIVVATILFTSAYGHGTHHDKKKPDHQPDNPHLFRSPSLFSRVTSFNLNRYYHHQSYSDQYEAHHDHPDFPVSPMTPPPFSRPPSFLSRVASFTTHWAQAQHVTVAPQQPADVVIEEEAKRGSEEVGQQSIYEEEKLTSEKKVGGAKSRQEEIVTMTKKEAEDDEKQAEADEEVAVPVKVQVRNNNNNTNNTSNTSKGGKNAKPLVAPRSRTVPFRSTDEEVDGGKKTKAVATARSKTVPFRGTDEEVDGGNKTKAVATARSKTVPFRGTDDEVDAKADDFINKFKHQLKMQRLESLLRHQSC